MWAKDRAFPEATNRPCVYDLNPDQFDQLASLPLHGHWAITNPIALDHEMNGYIRILEEIMMWYGNCQ